MILLATRPATLRGIAGAAYQGVLAPRRGPSAVLSSLSRGLRELGVPFELNRWSQRGNARALGVLSGIDALEAGVRWRSGTDGGRLLAGPNIVVLPSEARDVFGRAEIDLVVVPSPWVKDLYEQDMPELRGRVVVWPAGVDPHYWRPSHAREAERMRGPGHAVMFVKDSPGQANAPSALLADARMLLESSGLCVEEIRYGAYSRRAYLSKLQGADVMVAFSPSESQGVALVEAWSTNVPTLVWDQGIVSIGGIEYRSSSAPFLSGKTGAFFSNAGELDALLESFRGEGKPHFSPRRWVLDHMTDAICARRYQELAEGRRREVRLL